ncbi:tetratricopeptide repeat protein [Thiobacter aerophilum]|uniref:Tetratricopeptide repeat protein n=1 Tax=Thiobacter aerophilum TaxID=3121275 RepID=A0ABV0EI25_9BURK
MWRTSRRVVAALCVVALGLTRAQAHGDDLEQGQAAYRAGDYAQAFVMLAPLAEQGVHEAEYVLGEMYRKGAGVVADRAEAVGWLTRAASAGYVPAQIALGELLQAAGDGQDLEGALAWLKRAAEHGEADACFRLGLHYIRVAAHRDFAEAAQWMRRAALKGHAEAQYFLARLLLDGRGVEADEAQARSWFEQAARQGHGRAQRFLVVLARPDTPDRALELRELRRHLAAGTVRLSGVSTDPSYGTREKPIRAGRDYGAQWAYLNALRGPRGEVVHYRSLGPCCFFNHPDAPRGKAFLDRYEVQYRGGAPAILYFTLFSDEVRLEAPAGFDVAPFTADE